MYKTRFIFFINHINKIAIYRAYLKYFIKIP